MLAEASRDFLVSKEGPLFACSRRSGDIYPGLATGEGLYAEDTRHLSEFRVTIGKTIPVLLSSSAPHLSKAFIDAANPDLWNEDELVVPQLTLNVHRVRLLTDRLYERIEIANNGRDHARTELDLHVEADFADIFEVRGMHHRLAHGQTLPPRRTEHGFCLSYRGEDGVLRETDVWLGGKSHDIELEGNKGTVRWQVDLQPGQVMRADVVVRTDSSSERFPHRSFESAEANARTAAQAWERSCTRIDADSRPFERLTRASTSDLRGLLTPIEGHEVMAAGVPWFVAPFGRDSIITCCESLLLSADIARDTLRFLAAYQADADDPARDAEPGKILHELRRGELARAGYVPHSPYYGSIDATPLFLLLAAAYYRWTGDLELMMELRPALEAALRWIDEFGDQDGDGFIEYQRRSSGGLENQGWKDSWDAMVHADGAPAEGPIAVVEAQGYVYLAKVRIADVFDALGMIEWADRLRREAASLKVRFNEAYWMPEEGTLALALDGRKRQLQSVSSNPGHCLYCDIVDPDKAVRIAERLMAPDMFSGWGVRTLSQHSPAYNPMSYHCGSVWPHDNAIIASGMKNYGFVRGAERIATALFELAVESADSRLLELYCGYERRMDAPVVAYPVACRPQAWAAAAPFMLLQGLLGISADAPGGTLTVDRPALPAWLRRVELKDLRVGDSRVSLAFTRRVGEPTAFSLLEREGDIEVIIRH